MTAASSYLSCWCNVVNILFACVTVKHACSETGAEHESWHRDSISHITVNCDLQLVHDNPLVLQQLVVPWSEATCDASKVMQYGVTK